jgi:hypothetical protein
MRYPALLLLAALFVWAAADKGPPKGEAASKTLRLEATAYLDKTSIQQAVGSPIDEGIVVVTVTLTPSPGQKLTIDRDDFLLRSDKDGQKCTPYAPSQIAGSGTLRVKTGYGGGGLATQENRPAWGGIGGIGFPSSGSGIGNSASTEEAVASVEQDSGKQKENPLLRVLKQKILPEKEIAEPITGQLYFLLEGKHKPKDIELLYKTTDGRLSVRFKLDKDK